MSAVVKSPTHETRLAASSMLNIIAQAATDPCVDVIKMTALFELQERLLAREAEAEFNRSLRALNEHDLRVGKDGVGSFGAGKGTYKYATWEAMDEMIRPLMRQVAMWFSFDSEALPGGKIKVIGTLHHEGGHKQTAAIELTPDTGPGRNALQAIGSTISYGKRYTAEMLLNIVRADEDDDGASAAPPQRSVRVEQPTPPREAPRPEPTFLAKVQQALALADDKTLYFKRLKAAYERAPTMNDVMAIHTMPSVKETYATLPKMLQDEIDAGYRTATHRLSPQNDGIDYGPSADKPISEDDMKIVEDALHKATTALKANGHEHEAEAEHEFPPDRDARLEREKQAAEAR